MSQSKTGGARRHVNVPVFIPHLGCPHTCVFCNQRTISGVGSFDPDSVRPIIDEALSTVDIGDDCEIAFFGGSFTGIDRGLMTELLDIAESYVSAGRASRIRCSTRPDYIDDGLISTLQRYTIGTVELGIQSMSETVLTASERGHTPDDTRRAVSMLKSAGIAVGGQMMIGLPRSTMRDERECAKFIADTCSEARIYPTIVFEGTELCRMMRRGEYEPLTEADAVERTADALEILSCGGVRVLRVGLCDTENLHGSEYAAGPNHPAIGELASSRIFLKRIMSEFAAADGVRGAEAAVYVPIGRISAAVGHRGVNKKAIMSEFSPARLRFIEDGTLSGYTVKLTVKG